MADQTTDRLKKAKTYRYYICAIIFISYLLVFFHRLCPAVIALDMQKSFQATGALLGVLGSAYFYPYAALQFPVGLLADSWGPRLTVSVFFLLAAAGSLLMGLAPDLTTAVVGRVLVGAGVATVFVCNFKLLAEWFSPQRFAIMGGLFMATGGLGALVSSAPLAWVSELLGWRLSLEVVGAVTLLIAVLVYLIVVDKPQDKGWPAIGITDDKMATRISPLAGMKQVLTARRFWPISLWSFFTVGIFFSLGALWSGPYLMHVYGMAKSEAGAVLSMFAVSLIVGGPLLGYCSNLWGRKFVLALCSMVLCVVCFILALWPSDLPVWALYVLFFFFGLSAGPVGPVVATISKELFPIAIAGTAVGAVNLFPFLGGALFQIIMGAIVSFEKRHGAAEFVAAYRMMFLFVLACAIASAITAFFLTETLKKPSR